MLSFREQVRRIVPPFLSDRPGLNVGFRLVYSMAALCDAGMQWAIEGTRAAWPGQGTPTALPLIGRQRGILRGFAEPAVAYAARMLHWRDDQRHKGNDATLLDQVAGYLTGYAVPLRTVISNPDLDRASWTTRAVDGTISRSHADPSNWDWDPETNDAFDDEWSRTWLILYPPAELWTEGPLIGDDDLWGGAIGDDGFTIGSTATPEQIATLKFLANEWKPSGTTSMWIILAFDPDSFDPTGAPGAPLPDGWWGHWSRNVGGDQVPTRLETARYVDGS